MFGRRNKGAAGDALPSKSAPAPPEPPAGAPTSTMEAKEDESAPVEPPQINRTQSANTNNRRTLGSWLKRRSQSQSTKNHEPPTITTIPPDIPLNSPKWPPNSQSETNLSSNLPSPPNRTKPPSYQKRSSADNIAATIEQLRNRTNTPPRPPPGRPPSTALSGSKSVDSIPDITQTRSMPMPDRPSIIKEDEIVETKRAMNNKAKGRGSGISRPMVKVDTQKANAASKRKSLTEKRSSQLGLTPILLTTRGATLSKERTPSANRDVTKITIDDMDSPEAKTQAHTPQMVPVKSSASEGEESSSSSSTVDDNDEQKNEHNRFQTTITIPDVNETLAPADDTEKKEGDTTTATTDEAVEPNVLRQWWSQIDDKHKPYLLLIGYGFVFFICFILYFCSSPDFGSFIVNGLITNIFALVAIPPLALTYRYYGKLINGWTDRLLEKEDENRKLTSTVDGLESDNKNLTVQNNALQLSMADSKDTYEALLLKLKEDPKMESLKPKKISLLRGLRGGQMEIQLELSNKQELVMMLPLVCSIIALLPFGTTRLRSRLLGILYEKINKNPYVRQQFYFFLMSFYDTPDIARLFRKHRVMRHVRKTTQVLFGHIDRRRHTSPRTPFDGNATPITPDVDGNSPDFNTIALKQIASSNSPSHDRRHSSKYLDIANMQPTQVVSAASATASKEKRTDAIVFEEKDPVKLFGAPFFYNAAVGFRVSIPTKYQSKFCDPMNGTPNVQTLQVTKIFKSNARPYLIDCYCSDAVGKALLSSSFILKRGDDLRRDAAVLQMFRFFNDIWRDNLLNFNGQRVEALAYKCIAMAPDFGAIEMVPNCIELNQISSYDKQLRSDAKKLHRLIATASGSYIAAYLMGIRDRHDDNILIRCDDATVFHIDFGYMLGEKVSIDTNKFAITTSLHKAMGSLWHEFIQTSVRAWQLLRKNKHEIIDFARVTFQFLHPPNEVETFLRDTLRVDDKASDAAQYLESKIARAPKGTKTKIKNFVHGIAQKMKT